MVSAKKAGERLSVFEFKNLIGRAGRLDKHLCGMVYCIQVPDEEQPEWIEAYREEAEKEVKPTVDERLASSFEEICSVLTDGSSLFSEDDVNNLRGTVTILRSRFIQSYGHALKYLSTKNLTDNQRDRLLAALSHSTPLLTIPRELVLKNPYIDPFLQDRLYKQVLNDPKEWIIRRVRGFATDFESVFKKLNEVFHIIDEIKPIGNHDYYRSDLLTFAKLWLRGKPFKEIVTRALPRQHRDNTNVSSDEVDKAIKKAMGFITKDVSYITAKYFSVLSVILKNIIPEDEWADYERTISLPLMLELGCSDPKSMALISACIPRGAAIQIGSVVPDSTEDPVAWLMAHQNDFRMQRLSSIYHKILRRCGIWQ